MERHIAYREFDEMKVLALQAGLTIEDLSIMLYLYVSKKDGDTLKAHLEKNLKALS